MTVRDAVKVLKQAKKITLGYGANVVMCDVSDPLVLDAFADYVVDEIYGAGDDEYEINIAVAPLREGKHA